MAILLGLRVLGREERQRKGKKKKEIEWCESVGVGEIREDALRRLRKHTYTSTHIQFHSEFTTKTRLCIGPASEIRHGVRSPFIAGGRRSHRLHSCNTRWRPLFDVQ